MKNTSEIVYRARGVWENRAAQSQKSTIELKQEETLGDIYYALLRALQNHNIFDEQEMAALREKGQNMNGVFDENLALGAALLSEAVLREKRQRRDISV